MKRNIWQYLTVILIIISLSSFPFKGRNDQMADDVKRLLYSVPENLITDLDKEIIAKKSERIDKIFTNLYKRYRFNATVLFSEKGRIIYKNAFGMADFKNHKDLNTHSSFQLASVSKMFTAMAIMILKEEGKLTYEDDIRDHIDNFPYEGITIRNLLTHRSGLPRYMSIAHKHWKNKRKPLTNDNMLDLFREHPPQRYFAPDKGFHYCNSNYAVLASIVEKISGITFDKFAEEKIFKPLNMTDSFIYNMNEDSLIPYNIPKGVTGYRYRGWRIVRERNDYLNGVMGDKGVYSSVEDIFKFDQGMYNETLVSDSTLGEAFESGSPKYWKRRNNYGFGWRIKEREDSTVFHYGWWKGFRTFYIRDMKTEKTIIVLSNKDKGPSSQIFWNILRDERDPLGFIKDLN